LLLCVRLKKVLSCDVVEEKQQMQLWSKMMDGPTHLGYNWFPEAPFENGVKTIGYDICNPMSPVVTLKCSSWSCVFTG
jgi:hypothetical protein